MKIDMKINMKINMKIDMKIDMIQNNDSNWFKLIQTDSKIFGLDNLIQKI